MFEKAAAANRAANPILIDIPERLETERLILRAPRAGDGAAVFEAVAETLVDLRKWPASLPWALIEPSVETSETFCRRGQAAFLARSDLPMFIFLKEGNVCIGGTGLHRVNWLVPKFEIGYWIRKRFHGRGVATEVVRALMRFAFSTLDAKRVEILTDMENVASRRVAENAGFALEGILHNDRITPAGELRNTCVYAVTGRPNHP